MTPPIKDRIVDTDGESLTFGQQVQHLEVEGYVVLPDMLSPEHIARLLKETPHLPVELTDYTDKKKYANDIQWTGGVITDLVAHPPMIDFLTKLFGNQPIMMTYDYVRSEPGCPPIVLHSDSQPWGSKIFGPEQSCPKLVRVLYYLRDLTPESAPFRVVPRSHLSFHNDANPYLRYREHPEQAMVTCRAGSAAIINQSVFHGNYPNQSETTREMLGIAYRPTWAGPCNEVRQWDEDKLAKLSPEVQALMTDRNTRVWSPDADNIQPDMPSDAPGISPSRWDTR